MAQVSGARGYHYEGDGELITNIQRRRERLTETHNEALWPRARHGRSVVCLNSWPNELGMFERYEIAVCKAVRYCQERLRNAIGRFK